MSARIDLNGIKFGSWIVLGYVGTVGSVLSAWLCRCDCGTERNVAGQTLRAGTSVSCGCTKGAAISKARTKHGCAPNPLKNKKATRTYTIWQAMRARCAGKSEDSNLYYASRGISVCERWDEFNNFLADMGEAPKGMSIDRIDNDGNYEKDNCRWATDVEQAGNRRPRNTVIVDYRTLRKRATS